ncbi:MAG TPA: penicillin acylase family protein [Longimicrobiales bacterium]|nr:penicillin acylase family protein [Longimicrobiales bacterium]
MKKLIFALVFTAAACAPAGTANPDAARWEARARTITIVRDDWGIAHVHGPTDADAVFGMIYAQAEDDFNRVEVNLINSQGRLAEAEGEQEIWRDLRMKLFIAPAEMKALYAEAPDWLRSLMDAWADGLNYYLHKHPEVTPKVITHFEPWMALTFSEGSIGGDIERVNLRELEAFYGRDGASASASSRSTVRVASADAALEVRMASIGETWLEEPSGSNGFAIAPSNTADGHALLWINPHTSFFFREELQMTSDEGLNAYGAVTWGQFFVYQGFNERAGWMHTSSNVDNIDEYLETVTEQADGSFTYRYGDEERPVVAEQITVPYKTGSGMAERTFTVYRTHHGPVVRSVDGKWVAVRLMEEPLKALNQSFIRTKARNLEEFRQSMELHTNSSNNTVYADADGNIAYFHANFIPRRDTRFDWDAPVDGSDPATEWGDVLSLDESPNMFNPANGWIQNTNNWPYTVSGAYSPRQSDYPSYVERGGENPRGVHAIRVLDGKTDFTPQSLVDAAYDSYLPAFADMIPALLGAYDRAPASELKSSVAEQIETLRAWDYRWGAGSVPTSLAVFWGEDLFRSLRTDAESEEMSVYDYAATAASANQLLGSLATASAKLTDDFGTWRTPWGDINRFQRLTGDIVQPFDDEAASIPVPFTSSRWGSLASFGARAYPGTKKWYGTSGNSFVAVVQFGDSVRARAVTAGGLNSDPASPHFNDQAQRYADGNLRDVYFYPDQLQGHTERTYHPGG